MLFSSQFFFNVFSQSWKQSNNFFRFPKWVTRYFDIFVRVNNNKKLNRLDLKLFHSKWVRVSQPFRIFFQNRKSWSCHLGPKKCGLFETEEMTAWNDSSEEQTYNWNDLTDLIVAIKRRIKIKMALIARWRFKREPDVVTAFEVVFAK